MNWRRDAKQITAMVHHNNAAVTIQMRVFNHMQRPESSLCTKQSMQQSV